MSHSLAKSRAPVTLEQALVQGDLSGLDAEQRVNYYLKVCTSLNLNPYTKPFDYLTLNGRLILYARKDATDQLRKLHKVSVTKLDREQVGDLMVVTASAIAADGRADTAIGAVPVQGLKGEALANALMKAETKAKRRVTLSLCGLGMTDESEVGSIPDAYPLPAEAYVPTREREVDDESSIVRSADERIWQRYLELLDQARALALNPKPVSLPIARDDLKDIGSELVAMIAERQHALDNEEAARISGRAQDAARARDVELDQIEAERQRKVEGLK